MRCWAEKSEITQTQILIWIGLWSSTFSKWTRCYGKAFEHNGWIPRDHWLDEWEKQAILKFHFDNPLNGYRRLTYMMLDADVVAVSASSVYRVLGRCNPDRVGVCERVQRGSFAQRLGLCDAHGHAGRSATSDL